MEGFSFEFLEVMLFKGYEGLLQKFTVKFYVSNSLLFSCLERIYLKFIVLSRFR